jgi:hypothetical protein
LADSSLEVSEDRTFEGLGVVRHGFHSSRLFTTLTR